MSAVRRIVMAVAGPLLAVVVASIIASLILLGSGDDVAGFWSVMFSVPEHRNLVSILNQTAILYLSGVAAAIGFRMNLFNIGVEGQYRLAGFAAGAFAGQAWLPGALNTVAAILVAMLTGALWAGIAGLLRTTRGVSEVISTIMLNAIAGSLIGYLISRIGINNGNATNTKAMPESTHVGTITIYGDSPTELYGLSLLAIVVGICFWVLLNRTRFGFDLRAAGASESAAVASGVSVKKMIVVSMLLSGAVAGLVGLPVMFSDSFNYGSSFQTGLGFTGIAVALLGRNHPVGIASGALIFAFLSQQAIAYEVVRRYGARLEQAQVAAQLARQSRNERSEAVAS